MKIKIPKRIAETGDWEKGLFDIEIVELEISDSCSICSEERGYSEDQILISQKEKSYMTSKWKNSCGHKDFHAGILLET